MLLVTEGTETDDPSVFGEEAHIVSAAPDGPRHGPLPSHDVYDNLILLCSKHHKQVDDQVGHYTVDLLKQIKRDHEEWVRSRDEPGPVRLVHDPKYPIPKALTLCITGTQLWNNMEGVRAFHPSWPDGLSEDTSRRRRQCDHGRFGQLRDQHHELVSGTLGRRQQQHRETRT